MEYFLLRSPYSPCHLFSDMWFEIPQIKEGRKTNKWYHEGAQTRNFLWLSLIEPNPRQTWEMSKIIKTLLLLNIQFLLFDSYHIWSLPPNEDDRTFIKPLILLSTTVSLCAYKCTYIFIRKNKKDFWGQRQQASKQAEYWWWWWWLCDWNQGQRKIM